ncbi:hypothetical protein AQI88_38855 [Streptomyces cellostaticus]|uniref:Uncharacterized protein n=1 Tax=Streptomyces cellostaticus TaxID=67285 RepID=A0A101NBR7_9ACTN|nr:hypothetical protein AQI88_38855 [Streptomyces cellostaticus]
MLPYVLTFQLIDLPTMDWRCQLGNADAEFCVLDVELVLASHPAKVYISGLVAEDAVKLRRKHGDAVQFGWQRGGFSIARVAVFDHPLEVAGFVVPLHFPSSEHEEQLAACGVALQPAGDLFVNPLRLFCFW